QQSFVNPDSPEYCNSIDDNCDGAIDEDPIDASQWFADVDGDGYGDPTTPHPGNACDQPKGYVNDHTDCDDRNPTVWTDVPGLQSSCARDASSRDASNAGCASGSRAALPLMGLMGLLGFQRRRRYHR
ncbi:MAG: MopE-related protein, partial [Myxococcota bacterium]